ncbi:hypothetical protein D5085_14520 [Ectothiorhodospiraceae bacterium BW-2]|nr:hypothetical protein D5085_14520 [Ectothiorhodospiraceae bacterium BW-2]
MRLSRPTLPAALLFSILFTSAIVVTGYGIFHLERSNRQLEQLFVHQDHVSQTILQMRDIGLERVFIMMFITTNNDPFVREEYLTRYRYLASNFIQLREQFEALTLVESQQHAFNQLLSTVRRASFNQDRVVRLLEEEATPEALRTGVYDVIRDQYRLTQAFNNLFETTRHHINTTQQRLTESNRNSIYITLLVAFGLFPVTLLLAISILLQTAKTQQQLLAEQHETMVAKEELEELTADLERLVTKRTFELQQSNADLQQTINHLQTAQQQLVQSEKMASLGNLVAGIAHEINTPIGVGLTATTSLNEEVAQIRHQFDHNSLKKGDFSQFISHAEQACHILQSNLQRAAELIRSFKQVAVDQGSDQWRQLGLRHYIDEITLSLRPKLKRRLITVENQIAADLSLYTHPGAIYQMISNLILNSLIHAFNEDETGTITIDAYRSDAHLTIEYLDNGHGMDETVQQHLFDPFFTTRRHSGGSGLGLHIVYNLVTSTLQGSITVSSQVGSYSRFQIQLPEKRE